VYRLTIALFSPSWRRDGFTYWMPLRRYLKLYQCKKRPKQAQSQG
jgi:hypothetical protein